MELAGMTMYKTLVMTILALVGVFCYHKKIVDQEMNKKLSELVLSLFTPVLLFTSFQKDFSKELVTGLMISVLLSAIAFFLIWCICKWVVRKLDKDYAVVELVALTGLPRSAHPPNCHPLGHGCRRWLSRRDSAPWR